MTAIGATLRIRREGALRSRAARGDAVAFAAVYERHHQALYRYCRSILRHEQDAQDALQSTMTRAFAALQDEPRDFELRPWLFRIAHNEAISILRRRRATGELEDQPAFGELEDRVAEREELRLLELDLADLPERQRAALVLRELNGLSHVEIGIVLEASPAAVKQAIFEARSALFSCREGREMACHDIRRMLSDGDGRVLRGRAVRAHLRSCPGCRRFRTDLEQRPKALRALAPPLPIGSAAALLAQLLGGGGTAAKLLACIAIAGGGTTIAVEMQSARAPLPAATAEVSRPAPDPPAKTLPVVAAAPQAAPAATPEGEKRRAATPRGKAKGHTKSNARGKAKGHAKALGAGPAEGRGEAPAPAKDKALGEPKAPKAKALAKAKKHVQPKIPPGQAKKVERASKVPPGQAKKVERASKVPPGQAKKDDAATPIEPGEQKTPGKRGKGEK
jgi:RNA polymerase sigma factor (sigma-70 family)